MPQPSAWWSVRPPRCAKPVKLNVTSVGVLQFIPSSWHMRPLFASRRAAGGEPRADQLSDLASAQARQMQALPPDAAGTFAITSVLKFTRVHQHGGCFSPVAFCRSMAQVFGPP